MTDLEIDKALALAIGWKEEDFNVSCFPGMAPVEVCIDKERGIFPIWKRFSHTDWSVAGPIGERYDCYPTLFAQSWGAWVPTSKQIMYADTPQKAIALAVIGAKK